MKSKNNPKSLVCLNNLEKVILKNGISNRKNQKHFQILVTACNPNTRDDCELNPEQVQEKMRDLNI